MTAKSQTDLKALIVSGGVGRRNDIHDIIDSIPILNSDPGNGIQVGDGTDRNLQILFDLVTDEIIQWNNSSSRFEVSDDVHISGNLIVSGPATLTGGLTVNGSTDLNGTLSVSGDATLSANLTMDGGSVFIKASNAILQYQGSDGLFKAQTQYISSTGIYRLNIVDDVGSGQTRMEFRGGTSFTEVGLGITGTAAPVSGIILNAAGAVAFPGISFATFTADQNNFSVGRTSYAKIHSDASRNLTGITGGKDGRILRIENFGTNNIVLTHQDAASTAANRFKISDGANLTLTPDDIIEAVYSGTDSRWSVQQPGMGLHASSHLTGGSDEVDGDKLDIDFTPTNYQPDTAPAEADSVDNLTAHLKGIDTMLELSRSITVENPGASEDISIFFTNKSITVTEIRAVLIGSATPSVTWTIRHGTDRSAAGAEVVTGGTTTTSTTTGDDVTSFNDETIDADSYVWFETTAQSGTVTEIHITIFYRKT